MMILEDKLKQAGDILDRAIEQYKPVVIISLLSGGHDSLTATAFAVSHLGDRLTGVAHIDTGIGIPETQQFVVDICTQNNWPLKIYRAVDNVRGDGTPDPQVYDDIVIKHGFPGPGAHRFMYSKLKERQVRRLVRDHKQGRRENVMLISGVRRAESSRRMGNVEEVTKNGSQIWVAPMMHFVDEDQQQMMTNWSLPKNPVKAKLCMSGECLCGAFAQKGELAEIEFWYPEVAARIKALEVKVMQAGHKKNWESGDFSSGGNPATDSLSMCVRCENRFLASEEQS